MERFTNGKTYRVRDLGSEQERQVTREQVKVWDIPPAWGKEKEQRANELPRLGHIEMGEGVIVPQVQSEEENDKPGERNREKLGETTGEGEEGIASPDSRGNRDEVPPFVETQRSGSLAQKRPGERYLLRQVPERLALQAERRKQAEQQG